MKLPIKITLLAITALTLSLYLQSCGSSDRPMVGENQPGVILWKNNCNRCHNFRPQNSYDAKTWGIVARHMRIHGNLTGKEIASIKEFLIGTTASAPVASAHTPAAVVDTSNVTADLEGGKQYYATRCAVCHGASGKGDGAASAALNPKPRNFQDDSYWKGTNAHSVKNIILNGGAAGGKSATMPPSPDLAGNPELLEGVYQYIKSLEK